MEVSVIPVVPAGKTELRRFHRAELATAGQR